MNKKVSLDQDDYYQVVSILRGISEGCEHEEMLELCDCSTEYSRLAKRALKLIGEGHNHGAV